MNTVPHRDKKLWHFMAWILLEKNTSDGTKLSETRFTLPFPDVKFRFKEPQTKILVCQ